MSEMAVMTFREILGKPSSALQAMVDGLRSCGPNFVVYMNSFGHIENGICYGCAATCCIQKATGKQYADFLEKYPDENPEDYASFYGISVEEFSDFEGAMDLARRGFISSLLDYFDIDAGSHYQWDSRFKLDDGNWQTQLFLVDEVIADMKAAGI